MENQRNVDVIQLYIDAVRIGSPVEGATLGEEHFGAESPAVAGADGSECTDAACEASLSEPFEFVTLDLRQGTSRSDIGMDMLCLYRWESGVSLQSLIIFLILNIFYAIS